MRKKITSNYLLSLVTATKESKKKKQRERKRENGAIKEIYKNRLWTII